jgi:PEP-CTERM motif
MIKNSVFLTILILALPLAAFANGVDFTNSSGTLSGTNSGLTLAGSTLIAVNGLGSGLITGTDLGTLSFRTGNLSSGGLLQMGGTFAAGGMFNITGNGASGIPNGVIFNGSFTGPLTWTLVTLSNGTHNYTLTGSLVGTWQNGTTVNGATVQLTINTGRGFFNGKTNISSGDTNIVTTVPEPGTLGLLGTGLIGVAGIVRRKLKSV